MAEDDDEDDDVDTSAEPSGYADASSNPYAKYVGGQTQQQDVNPYAQYAGGQQQDANPYAKYVGGQQPDQQQPKAESPFWTTLRHVAHGLLPSAAGLAAIPGGIAAGAAIGLPEAGIGAIPGALIGGGLAYMGASAIQEKGAKLLGFGDDLQMAADDAANPKAAVVGDILSAAPFLGPGAAPAAVRAGGALFGAGMEAFNQWKSGEDFDPARLAIAGAGGALLTTPTRAGEAIGSRAAAAIGRPDLWHGAAAPTSANDATAHPPPVDQAVGDPQNKPTRSETDYDKEGTGSSAKPAPAEQGATNTDPALDAAIRAKMEPGEAFSPVPATAASAKQSNVIPFDEPFVPRGKGDYVPPEVDMSPEAVAKRAKSDEMTARFAREREEETAWRRTQRGQEEQPPGPAGAAAEPEIPTATSAKLEAQFPRVAPGVEGRPLTGEPAAPVQSAQPPAAAQAAIANSKGFSVRWNPDEFQFEAVSKDGKVIGHLLDAMPEKGTPENPAFTAGAEVDEPWRRKGVASALYDAFAAKHDGNIAPAGNTSREAWDFWLKKYPDKTADYVKQQAADIAANARSGNFDPEAFTDQSIRNNYDHPKIQDMIIKELRSATPAAPSVAAEQRPGDVLRGPEPGAPVPATPAIRKLGDIEIAKNPDGPGYVVRRGDDVLSEHDTLRQANARMIKQANAASPADKALPNFYEQQKAQAQAQFAKEAVRRVGDIAIVKNPDGPGYVVMRGDDILSQHNNIGQAHLGLNRAVKQANLPLPPDEAFAPAPAAPDAPAPARTRPEVVVPAKAKGPRARDPETYSLLEYLAAKGGLKPSPELTTIFGGTNPFIPGFGRLIRKTGMHLDKAWEAAARSSQYINDPSDRAGGLAKTSINDLLDLIDKENRGAKQYQLGQEGTATASERDRAAETNRVAIGRAVDNFAEQSGYGEIEPKLYDRTVQIMEKEGVSDPDIAFERALMEDHERNEKDIRTRQETVGDIPGWDDAVPRAAREAGSSLRQAGLELEPAGRGAETTAGEGPRGPSEMGAEGRPQTVIPGAERISEAELAQRRADERLKPTAPQRPADDGLFGDTHLQEDLFTGGRNELLQQRVNAADIAPDPAAHLRETAAMYREQGQEGRARQLEQGANAIERSQQQQQQQQQRQQPAAAGGGPPKPPTVGQAAAAGGGKLPPGPTSMAYAPPQNRSNLSKLWRSMKLLVGSDIGPYGRQAENIIRGAYGRAKRVFEQTMNLLNPHMETVRNMDPMDRAALMNRVEGGKDFPNWQPTPDQQRIIDVYKPAMDLWKDQFSKLDRTAQMKFVTDYLAHMYKNPAQASEFFSQFGKRGGAGSTKGRTHATYEDAKKAGLEPLTDNPIEIATRYGLSMTNFIASNDALERAVETGVVGYFSSGKSVGATGSPEPHQVGGPPPGWKKLNAPPKGPFLEAYAPEDFADKYNAFYSQGLRGVHAPIYDALRSANAGWTMMELGLNAYHFFTMANEAIISDVKRGLDQLFTGQIKEGAKTIAGAPLAPGTRYIEGKRFQREYLDPNSTNPIASIMAEANARPVGRGHAYDILGSAGDENISRGSFIKNFDKDKINSQLKQAWDDVKDDWGLADSVGKQAMFPFKQASRVLQTVGAPLFDKYIPALKAGAMHSQMADWLAANPHIDINTPAGRQAAVDVARKISDSVDNAFGEMVHDNLFMNQALRHAAMVAMRSFSWSIGAMRQIGGGTYAAGKAAALSLKTGENRFSMAHPEFDPRISYAIAFPFVVATISAIYQGLRAGEAPQDWRDLYAPRTGGTVPGLGGKGQVPEHALMPGFQKDVYGWLSHPLREGYAKLGGLPTTALEQITNRDWRGDPIAQRGASPIDQFQQRMAHLFSKLGPIGARAIAKGQPATSGITPVETALGFRAPGVDIQDPQRLEKWMAASAKKEWKAKERHDKTEQRKYARERTYDPQEREQQPQ